VRLGWQSGPIFARSMLMILTDAISGNGDAARANGLRAGVVAGRRADWRLGEIIIVGKDSRRDELALPADASEAVAAYLQRGR
jgi:hypothetical protein